MNLLICGGRDFGRADLDQGKSEAAALAECELAGILLDGIHAVIHVTMVTHGKARGADALGAVWCKVQGLIESSFPARWKSLGRGAGPQRNKVMRDASTPDYVLAFPGGNGTADMVRLARSVPIKVIEVV